MERSWTMVTVMGKGNWERMVLPSTPLLELTMYQQMHTNRMRTNSRTSDLDTSIPAASSGHWLVIISVMSPMLSQGCCHTGTFVLPSLY